MFTLLISDVLKDKILVTRESARVVESAVSHARGKSGTGTPVIMTDVTFDFAGIEGVSPSFVDELVRVFESLTGSGSRPQERHMIVKNPPARLSSKFEAIARGHAMTLQSLPDGSWLWTCGASPG